MTDDEIRAVAKAAETDTVLRLERQIDRLQERIAELQRAATDGRQAEEELRGRIAELTAFGVHREKQLQADNLRALERQGEIRRWARLWKRAAKRYRVHRDRVTEALSRKAGKPQ